MGAQRCTVQVVGQQGLVRERRVPRQAAAVLLVNGEGPAPEHDLFLAVIGAEEDHLAGAVLEARPFEHRP